MNKTAVGYQALITQFNLDVLPHYRTSSVREHGALKTSIQNQHETHAYPKNYALDNPSDPYAQLEFALKHDGVNLEILSALFDKIDKQQLTQWICKRPTSKYTRSTWYLFEMLKNKELPIADCKKLKYIDLLNPKKYFTGKPIKSSRHGVNDNLLGNRSFCPIIRRTPRLETYIKKEFDQKAKKIIGQYSASIIARANNYLLTKETMSSYEIEHERPNKHRAAKFIDLLQKASAIKMLDKKTLIECQNTIVDYRFVDDDYRTTQNYVGENINQYLQKIHFISPQPNDLPELMDGLLNSLDRMIESSCHPVIMAAAISFGFVFLHPFEDGNGRLHRFLIHYILAKQAFTPAEVIVPISAIILQKISAYDVILESFSRPLMEKITKHDLTDEGKLTVGQRTKHYYQYIDFSAMAEYLFSCIEETIELHFTRELDFLANYDKTKIEIQSVIDMPDKLIDLFIRLLIQNHGKLSKSKLEKHFSFLTEKELAALTEIVISNMPSGDALTLN